MSGDGTPTGEQLARIEQGVRARIRRRAAIRQGVIGGVAAVLLLGGGIAVLPHAASGTSTSGAAAGSGNADGSTAVVACHDSAAADSPAVRRPVAGPLPAAALAACAQPAAFQSGSGAASHALTDGSASPAPQAAPASPSPSAVPGVLCRSKSGALSVYPTDDAGVCARNGLLPY